MSAIKQHHTHASTCCQALLPESAPRLAQSVALAVGLQDVDVVRQAVEQGSREPLGAQDLGPGLEREVGGDQAGDGEEAHAPSLLAGGEAEGGGKVGSCRCPSCR